MDHKRGMQKLIDKEWKKGLVIFAGLVLFHITFSILLSIIARSAVLSSLHNGHGLWNFTLDSFAYHDEAVRLLELLRDGDYAGWWQSSPWWHVKWIGLSYAVLTPDPLSYAPINGLTWAITIYCVYKIVNQLFPDRRRLAPAAGARPRSLLRHRRHAPGPDAVRQEVQRWGAERERSESAAGV